MFFKKKKKLSSKNFALTFALGIFQVSFINLISSKVNFSIAGVLISLPLDDALFNEFPIAFPNKCLYSTTNLSTDQNTTKRMSMIARLAPNRKK